MQTSKRVTFATLFAAACALTPAALAAQAAPSAKATSSKSAGKSWTAPKALDGHPDLQGIWDFKTLTPMERPAEFADKATLTETEAAEWAKKARQGRVVDDKGVKEGGAAADLGRSYNDFWRDFGTAALTRTSLIIDPPNGKMPSLTAEAQKRVRRGPRITENPEEVGVAARCLLGFNVGPPMFPGNYNNYMQLVQTRDYVMIQTEMVHDARSIPLDGRPFTNIRQWKGESRGHWEGETLVVETKNFLAETAFPRSSANLHLIERFSLSGPNALLYQFTVDDPTTWTKPWTAELPMTRTQEQIYEFACHEGNEAMVGVLKGARTEEKKGAAQVNR
jgi:hypothetical protein